jgi:integrase/recombinase XerC
LCERARPELACLGELAVPLVAVVGIVEHVGTGRGVEALADPTFALDVLTAVGPDGDPAVVGRVLDFLRARTTAGAPAVPKAGPASPGRPPTLTDAAARYRSGALALMAPTTQSSYWPWVNRLVAAHGDQDPGAVTAGDLKDLIAAHVLARRSGDERGRTGRATERMAVAAFRHFWAYLGDKRWATDNVALRLRKPAAGTSTRRGWRPDEAALVRHLARGLKRSDPLLNEVTLSLSERMGLRREEARRLRLCDIDLDRATAKVWGKGDKPRDMPIPPMFGAMLRDYVEQRRPPGVAPEAWSSSDVHLLRYKPTGRFPQGRRVGYQRSNGLFESLRKAAPDLFADGDLVLHSYRHALGTWCEANYTRTMARRALGHMSNQDATDSYLKVTFGQLAEALAAYEQYLLAADPHHQASEPAHEEAA